MNSFKTDKQVTDTQTIRAAAEAELQLDKVEAMSIGKLKKKENPRVLKPLSAPDNKSDASKSISTSD
jgi:hypothetical protein